MKNKNIQIVKYTKTHKQGVLLLLSYMWKTLDDKKKRERFEWRYEKNPFKEPCIYLAIEGHKIVAFRAFIAQRFNLKEKNLTIFSPSDTIVHPDYRRMGLMSKLNEIAINEIYKENDTNHSFLLNTTTSKKSMPVYINEHWQETDVLKHFHYKFYLFNHFLKKRNRLTISSEDGILSYRKKDYDIIITKTINGKELFSFRNKNCNKQVFINIRDEAFYRWKYSYQSENYTLAYCKRGGELVAYFILKRLTKGRYSLEEYLATDLLGFKIILKEAQKKLRYKSLRSWALKKEDRELLLQSGFISEPIKFLNFIGKQRFPILVRPIVPKPTEKDFFIDEIDIRKIKNWHLQIADRH